MNAEEAMRLALEGKYFVEHTDPRSPERAKYSDGTRHRIPNGPRELPQQRIEGDLATLRDAIATVYGIPPEDVVSANRTPKVIRARRHYIYEAERRTGLSSSKLGMLFAMDHSNIIYHVNKFHEKAAEHAEEVAALAEVHP